MLEQKSDAELDKDIDFLLALIPEKVKYLRKLQYDKTELKNTLSRISYLLGSILEANGVKVEEVIKKMK